MDSPFSIETATGRALNNTGFALAADMGLIVAHYLLEDSPTNLRWKIVHRPKSDMSYRLPVLDVKNYNHFDPIGGSIAEAQGILRGDVDFEIWSQMYTHWLEKAKKHRDSSL